MVGQAEPRKSGTALFSSLGAAARVSHGRFIAEAGNKSGPAAA